jgi:Mrp family chromosome partitioning ATPase
MRVVTFYSFKGGVGRTLALLNVAASLVARGNRVLIVDFDLEAPGLDRALGLGFRPTRGIVGLINDYVRGGQVPSIEDYVAAARFRQPESQSEAEPPEFDRHDLSAQPLLVLPAGLRDDESDYRRQLQSISFKKLYQEQDGYVFFDDIRQQFGKALARDYVLIDSRTGHTDIGKICTQQLPDHVVGLMVPNHQNLAGMRQEIADIRERHEMCDIDLVLSRVPRLDDLEDQLLGFEQKVREATKVRRILRVHAAESLALLQDEIYCAAAHFDRAQLTKDYKRITKAILVRNIESREAVLYALEGGVERVLGTLRSARRMNAWFEAVLASHANDVKVLEALEAALRAPQFERLREGVKARIGLITQTSEAAVAVRAARAAREGGDARAEAQHALAALQGRRNLSRTSTVECFIRLCSVAPDDADRFVREQGAHTIGALLEGDEIMNHERELLSTRGGAEAVLAVLRHGHHFERMPCDPDGRRDPIRMGVDLRLRNPLRVASSALGRPAEWLTEDLVTPLGGVRGDSVRLADCGAWMLHYLRSGNDPATEGAGVMWPFLPPVQFGWPSGRAVARDVTAAPSPWSKAHLHPETPLEVKGFAAVMSALSGDAELATLLIREIDEKVASGDAALADLVGNCWRMLYTPLRDLRDDLHDLLHATERTTGRGGRAKSASDLPRLIPPLGTRRGQESK